jgi:hypothetical protein
MGWGAAGLGVRGKHLLAVLGARAEEGIGAQGARRARIRKLHKREPYESSSSSSSSSPSMSAPPAALMAAFFVASRVLRTSSESLAFLA